MNCSKNLKVVLKELKCLALYYVLSFDRNNTDQLLLKLYIKQLENASNNSGNFVDEYDCASSLYVLIFNRKYSKASKL